VQQLLLVGVLSFRCIRQFVDPLSGYLPADHAVRDYLSTSGSKDIAYNRSSAFLQALFENMNDFLRDVSSSDYIATAKLLRTKMTVGQHMNGHNQYRQDFYKGVIERASMLERQVRNIPVHYAQLRCSLVP